MEDLHDKKIWKQPKFLFGIGGLVFVALTVLVVANLSDKNHLLANFSASITDTFSDVFGFQKEKPIYELDLATGAGRDLSVASGVESKDSLSGGISESETVSASKESGEENKKVVVSNKNSDSRATSKANSESSKSSQQISSEKNFSTSGSSSSQNPPSQNNFRDCSFSSAGNLNREIVFNEMAWMGSGASANDEWIELKNNSLAEVRLENWQIKNSDESIKIVFGSGEKILAGGLFLLERTDDNSVLNVAADKVYVGAISNAGEWLKIFDDNCSLVDEIDTRGGWDILGGDNESKRTLERDTSGLGWHTSAVAGGTPKERNSEPIIEQPPAQPLPSQPASTHSTSSPQATSTPPSELPPPPQNQSQQGILISEVMVGSSASADDEFIEIYNYGSQAVDLTGWTIKKKSSSGAESSLVVASRLGGKTILPGKYFLLAHEGGYTGAVVADVTWPTSYSLAYTNNSITMYNASGATADQVIWTEIPKDKSYMRSGLDISAGFGVSESPSPQNSQ